MFVENGIQKKAMMILAGLAAMPSIASAATGEVQSNKYCAPYSDPCQPKQEQQVPDETPVVTGLSVQELAEAKTLVTELNQLDVVTATEMNLTKAPVIPYRYNQPAPEAVDAARAKNLERLAKLRAMIEAAK
jgi:hypothetical protein